MKNQIVFVFAALTLNTYGQEPGSGNFNRWQLGFNFSPDLCFRKIEARDDSASSIWLVNRRDSLETVKLGFSAGLNLCFHLSPHLALETGIQYSDKGYQADVLPYTPVPFDPAVPVITKFIYHFHYLDIPFKVNFTIGENNLRFIACAGLTTNFFFRETSTAFLEFEDQSTDRETNPTLYEYKRINLSPALSAGIDYRFNSRMNLRVEPTFRYGLLNIIEAPVTGWLYNGGLNVGFYYGL